MENQLEITTSEVMVNENTALDKVLHESGLQLTEAEQIKQGFIPFFERMGKAKELILKINFENPTPLDEKIAKEVRGTFRDIRTDSKKYKDAEKRMDLLRGNLKQATYNLIEKGCEFEEEACLQVEKAREIKQRAQEAALKIEREELLKPYVDDATLYPLGQMTEISFNELLEGRKLAHEKKVADALAAENARIEKEKADAAEREKQRLENEQLRKEAEAREKEMVAERTRAAAEKAKQDAIIAAERKKQDDLLAAKNKQLVAEKAAKDKAEADAKALRDAETKRILKKEAEEKFEADRKKEADRRAAAAPDKEKLRVWINSIQMGDTPTLSGEPNAVLLLIDEKFQAFKTWANEQINTL